MAPYLWIDATYLKERGGGRIVSTAVIVAVGVNTLRKREVLGVASGPSEAEPFWKGFLRSLADRGLRGIKLVISDDHKGLRSATPDRRPKQLRMVELAGEMLPPRIRVVLVRAHLDHDPGNNHQRNLAALCQRCHLAHDRPEHRRQRWAPLFRRRASGDLFLGAYQ